MDELIGKVVVFVIVILLTFATVRQFLYTRSLNELEADSIYSKQLKRKHKLMTFSLFCILVCYTVNICIGLNIISGLSFLSDITSKGAFVSIVLYFYTKYVMKPHRQQPPKRLYNEG